MSPLRSFAMQRFLEKSQMRASADAASFSVQRLEIPVTLDQDLMREPSRMQAVQSPVIPVVAELIRSVPGTISLGQGVVGYGPPREAIDELSRFLGDAENHKYKPVQGLPALLDGLERKLQAENSVRL